MTKSTKGVYNLNPTSMVMKQGSRESRMEASKPARKVHNSSSVPEAQEVGADVECTECDDLSHPAMQTRHSHPKNIKHADGRQHEDMHHAVKQMKG